MSKPMDISAHVMSIGGLDVGVLGAVNANGPWFPVGLPQAKPIVITGGLEGTLDIMQRRLDATSCVSVRTRGKRYTFDALVTQADIVDATYGLVRCELAMLPLTRPTVERIGRRRGWRKHIRREKARARLR